MSLVIAATDFSDVAANAVNYACRLAEAQNAQLLVVHSYLIPVMFNDMPMPGSLINETQHDAEHQMGNLLSHLQTEYPGLNVTGEVTYGDFIDIINEMEETDRPITVVIGNSSAVGGGSWPDNSFATALLELKYPVIAVPPGSSYRPIEKICFAYDNVRLHDYGVLDYLTALTRQLGSELHVLNIQPDVHNQDNEPDFDNTAKEHLQRANATFHMQFETGNVDAAIHDFVYKNNMDLLVMVPHRHSFFESLFHRSHTKVAASHIPLPVLAIHDAAK